MEDIKNCIVIPDDKKYVKSCNTEKYGDEIVHYIYLTLISQRGLKTILEFMYRTNGTMRMYAYNNLICVEIKIKRRMKK